MQDSGKGQALFVVRLLEGCSMLSAVEGWKLDLAVVAAEGLESVALLGAAQLEMA
jgi:hypothetical protein